MTDSRKERMTPNYQPQTRRSQGQPVQRNRAVYLCVAALSLALACRNAIASEQSSPIPFELPKRVDFLVPDRSSVIPEPNPPVVPERSPPAASKETPTDVPKKKSKKAPKSSPPVANSAPAASETVPSEPAPNAAVSAAPAPPEPASAAPASAELAPVEPVSGSTGKRYMLQGKTEVIEFRLSEFDQYKQGMAALDKRNYAGAEALFRAAAAKLDDGYEKYRAECNFFEAKCLMMQGKMDQSMALLKSAIALFDKHDPSNPYKLAAQKQIGDLLSGKARMDIAMLHAQTNLHQARVIDENIIFYSRVATDDSDPVLLRCEKEAISSTIHDCFAEMTCLETAELGSNVGNATGRWQPLLVKGEPAAFEFGAKAPVINVKVNGQSKEVPVNLPMVNGLRRVLLATDKEKICAIDVDNNDTWLLQMENLPDGTIGRVRWALLRHVKQKSATWGVSRNVLNKPHPTGNAWGSAPHNGFGSVQNENPRLYRNSQGRY